MTSIMRFKAITTEIENIADRFRANDLYNLGDACTAVVAEIADLLQISDETAREMFTTHLRETYQINAY